MKRFLLLQESLSRTYLLSSCLGSLPTFSQPSLLVLPHLLTFKCWRAPSLPPISSYAHSPGALIKSHVSQCHLCGENDQISISSFNLSPKLQSHISSYDLTSPVDCLNRNLKLNMLKTELLMTTKPSRSKDAPIFQQLMTRTVESPSLLIFSQNLYSVPHEVLMQLFSKFIQD